MGHVGGHGDALPGPDGLGQSAHGDLGLAVQDMHEGVSGRGMCADALALVKGEQGHVDRGLLGQGAADHTAFFIIHQGVDIQGLGKGDILDQFHEFLHAGLRRCVFFGRIIPARYRLRPECPDSFDVYQNRPK